MSLNYIAKFTQKYNFSNLKNMYRSIVFLALIIPMISLSQSDCGVKPKKPSSVFSNTNDPSYKKKLKKYKVELQDWKNCMSEKIGYDIDCKFASAGTDDFGENTSFISKEIKIKSKYKSIVKNKYQYYHTWINVGYSNEQLSITVFHQHDNNLNVSDDNEIILLLENDKKIKLKSYKSRTESKNISGVTQAEKKITNYYTGEYVMVPGITYNYNLYTSKLLFRISKIQLEMLSKENCKKIRLAFKSNYNVNVDIDIKERKSDEYKLSAKCVSQAVSELNIDDPITSIQNTSKWSGNGTGFFISSNGYIATNYHVIKNANNIEVDILNESDVSSYKAKVIAQDKINDLAILAIDDDKFDKTDPIPYKLYDRTVDVATEVFALGYPLALSLLGTEIKFTDGKISSKSGINGDVTVYQIQVPIQPGNSGGPLFDHYGNLVGITSSGVNRKYDITENVNFAIKSNYLLNLIDVIEEKIPIPNNNKLSQLSLADQVKILNNFVVLIKTK